MDKKNTTLIIIIIAIVSVVFIFLAMYFFYKNNIPAEVYPIPADQEEVVKTDEEILESLSTPEDQIDPSASLESLEALSVPREQENDISTPSAEDEEKQENSQMKEDLELLNSLSVQ